MGCWGGIAPLWRHLDADLDKRVGCWWRIECPGAADKVRARRLLVEGFRTVEGAGAGNTSAGHTNLFFRDASD